MKAIEIQARLREVPFRPFLIKMSSGEGYLVDHPELVFLTRNTVDVCVTVGADGIPDRTAHLSVLHIASLDPAPDERMSA